MLGTELGGHLLQMRGKMFRPTLALSLPVKGDNVVTIRPDQTVSDLLSLLAEHRIGAVVVSSDGEAVDGIVSERDVVRHLHSAGSDILGGAVDQIMTKEVFMG